MNAYYHAHPKLSTRLFGLYDRAFDLLLISTSLPGILEKILAYSNKSRLSAGSAGVDYKGPSSASELDILPTSTGSTNCEPSKLATFEVIPVAPITRRNGLYTFILLTTVKAAP